MGIKVQNLARITLLVACANAYSAAFGIKEQSTTNLGNAYAGSTVYAEDASTGWYNPAGLTYVNNPQISFSANAINSASKLLISEAKNNLSVNATGDVETKLSSTGIVPGLHFSYPINEQFTFSYNAVVPFGLESFYESTSRARYMATRSKITTIDNTFNIGYKHSDQWSFGFGIDAMYTHAILKSNTFYGQEGFVNNKGDGWGYGFHVGAIWQISDLTRIGITYNSKINPKLTGKVDQANNNVLGVLDTVETKVNLPDKVTYSVMHKYSDKWTAMADIEFTHWSVVKELKLNYPGNTTVRYIKEDLHYKNTWRFAFGSDYQLNETWKFKGGLAYEKSPVQDSNRTARVPDNNRVWLALGATYTTNKLKVDVGYAHLFIKNMEIDAKGTITSTTQGNQRLIGSYKKGRADVLGVQVAYNFDM